MSVLREKAEMAVGLVEHDGPAVTFIDPGTIILVFTLLYDAHKCLRDSHALAGKIARTGLPPSAYLVRRQVEAAMPGIDRPGARSIAGGIMRMAETIRDDEIAAMGREILASRSTIQPW